MRRPLDHRPGFYASSALSLCLALGLGSLSAAGPSIGPYIGIVRGSEVKIRTGGSQNHHAFSVVKMGQRVLVEREVNGWCRIHMPRWIPVFVHKDYLIAAGSRGTVKAGELNIRVGPERAHEPVGSLAAGSEVEILGREGDWLKIVPPRTAYAYLSQRYVVKEREVAPADVSRELALLSEAAEPGVSALGQRHGLAPEGRVITASLRQAEGLLQGLHTEDPARRDYSAVKAAYQEVIRNSEDRMEIAAAEEGLRKVEKLEKQKALLVHAQQSIAEVEKKNQELEERVRQARFSGRGAREVNSDAYLARGWVTGLGRFNGLQQGTHRLMKGSQVLYFLQGEEGKVISLENYLNKRVGVKGTIRELEPRFGANLIVASEVTVLSDL